MKTWQAIKLRGRLLLRLGRDLATKDFFRFSSKARQSIHFTHHISLTQEIKPSETFANKVFNLSTASQKINQHIILPNEIFSFWHVVGNPNSQFRKGRTIRNGKTIEETGGGVCQASGILYLLSLLAGLEILERHNHSVDLYTDETRFAPLGSDATVVYGYKDLRIKNNYKFPIKFELQIIEDTIKLDLSSTEKIVEDIINFRINQSADNKVVETLSTAGIISISKYKLLPTN